MDNIKSIFVGSFTAINIIIASYFGAFTPLLVITVVLMVCDLVTRVYAAWVRPDERVKSKKVWEGIYRKLGMCMLIFLTLVLDRGLILIADQLEIEIATKIMFTALTLAWIFVRELISNLENLQFAGVELPGFVVSALNLAKDKIDNAGDAIVKGGNNDEN